ncbi:hypothetical protein [Sorangium sp. So ce1389]|uniref:hypothetical protein n=1 Tax=Sorangium sp. So ce1389 TaxID=3133336 RepID=UPI003F5EC677
MAITIETNTKESISLEEYLEHVSTSVDLRDEDQVLASAEKLRALANNRQFLVERINRELLDRSAFQTTNAYSSQTLALGGGQGFFVRANMWLPPAEASGVTDWESQLYAYSRPHDHNFSFLTVGYWGSGYWTSIYEYDPERVIGFPGEEVKIRFLEKTSLPRGKVMFYRASRDIHTQEHPEEFSISLNLLLASPGLNNDSQFWFDLESGRIKNYVQSAASGRLMLCRAARYVGDGRTVTALENLAERHHFPRVRAAAYDALAALEAGFAVRIWARALDDKHAYVQHAARAALTALDG